MFMLILAFAAFLFLGGAIFTHRQVKHLRQSSTWAHASGAITSAQLSESKSYDEATTYSLDIRYSYAYSGDSYEGRVSSWTVYPSKRAAVADLLNYPEGTNVQVQVNPSDAQESEVLFDGLREQQMHRVTIISSIMFGAAISIIPFTRPPHLIELLFFAGFFAITALMLIAVLLPIIKLLRDPNVRWQMRRF